MEGDPKGVVDLRQLLSVELTADKGDGRLVVLRCMFKGETSALKLRANCVEDAREWAEALHTIAARNAVANRNYLL